MSPSPFYDRQRAEFTPAAYAAPDPMRQIRADLERDAQRREYVAGVESAMLAARWALPVEAAIEAERITRQGTNGLGLVDHLALDGVPISGDHRPRHGRHYPRGEEEVDSGHE